MHKPDPLPRVGPRVVLRRLVADDLSDFQAYRSDPKVGRYQGWRPLTDSEGLVFLETHRTIALFQRGKWFQIGIADRATNTLIGDIGLCVASNGEEAEIGFTLRTQSQGLGLGTEAVNEAINLLFEHTLTERVIGIADTRSLRCLQLLERVGMRRMETLSSELRGEPRTEDVFVLLRRDKV